MSWEKYCEYYRHKLYYSYDLFHLNQYLFLLVIAFTNSSPLIFPNTAFTLGQLQSSRKPSGPKTEATKIGWGLVKN